MPQLGSGIDDLASTQDGLLTRIEWDLCKLPNTAQNSPLDSSTPLGPNLAAILTTVPQWRQPGAPGYSRGLRLLTEPLCKACRDEQNPAHHGSTPPLQGWHASSAGEGTTPPIARITHLAALTGPSA